MNRTRHVCGWTRGLPLLVLASQMAVHAAPPLQLTASSSPISSHAVCDFGQISVRRPAALTHMFVLKNESKSPETVVELQPSCSCTHAVPAGRSLPFILAPGQKANIQMTLHPADAPAGPLHKFVRVIIKDQEIPAATLEMAGILPPAVLLAPAILDFGRLAPGSPRSLSLLVSFSPSLLVPGHPIRLLSSCPGVQIVPERAAPTVDASGYARQTYRVMLPSILPPGRFSAHVWLLLTPPGAGQTAEAADAAVPLIAEVPAPSP